MTTRDQAAATAGSAVIASRVALMTAAITTRSQMKRFKTEQRAESERERGKKRIQYSDSLRVSAQDLLDKITGLSEELPEKERFWGRGREPVPHSVHLKKKSGKSLGSGLQYCNSRKCRAGL